MKLIPIILLICFLPIANAHLESSIHLTDEGFIPTEIEIAPGTMVVFENKGKETHWPASNMHPTHEEYSEFDPKMPIKPGERWEFTFENIGEWQFHDHLNPQTTGTIIVGKEHTAGFFSELKGFLTDLLKIFQRKEKTPEITALLVQPSDFHTTNQINTSCSKYDLKCVKNSLNEITIEYGPQRALQHLEALQQQGNVSLSLDDHDLAHAIGRTTAEKLGITPEYFFECDTDFDYGCQHGFFEYVLSNTSTGEGAISLICDQINSTYSVHYKYRCYHGAGHGIMMAKAYDLNETLAVCDELETHFAQDGCWQGAFMENTNAIMRNQARKGYVSTTDALVPCTQMQEKYQYECFYNQAPWLMRFFDYDVSNASRACLQAPQNFIDICVQGLGLTLTSPKWHAIVIKNWKPEDFIENSWEICEQFPENYVFQCINGAVDNILNFDQLDITRAAEFCSIVENRLQEGCYQEIGRSVSFQATDNSTVREICNGLEGPLNNSCLKGANLVK